MESSLEMATPTETGSPMFSLFLNVQGSKPHHFYEK